MPAKQLNKQKTKQNKQMKTIQATTSPRVLLSKSIILSETCNLQPKMKYAKKLKSMTHIGN